MKNRTEEIAGKLKLSEIPEKPWTHLTVNFITKLLLIASVINFIQLVSPQLVDRFSQTKLCCKAPNKGYPHIYE